MNKNEMLELIEKKRSELIQIAMTYGFHSSAAVQYSQELDSLLNEYNRIHNQKVTTV